MTYDFSVFLARWQHASGSELANAQSFVGELAELLGFPPAEAGGEVGFGLGLVGGNVD